VPIPPPMGPSWSKLRLASPTVAPKVARSWKDLSSPEDKEVRMTLAEEWTKRGPKVPEGFKDWKPEDRVTWLDQNWPLDPPDMASVEQPQGDW
jgi:hypothetical protein